MQRFIPYYITIPTRRSVTCDTLIDNMFANNVGVNHVNGVLSHVISDNQITFSIILGSNYTHSKDKFIEVESINQRTLKTVSLSLSLSPPLSHLHRITYTITRTHTHRHNMASKVNFIV